MGPKLWIVLVAAVTLIGCESHRGSVGEWESLTPAQRSAVEDSVRHFVLHVADDVTRDGPAAWRKRFADSPSFFMAAEGRLVFPDSESATRAIQDLARTVTHIDLRWGDDLRVDPLTVDLAVVASSYQETRTDKEGHRAAESGFFTGLVQYRNGEWQFRDAHWSVPVPPSKVP